MPRLNARSLKCTLVLDPDELVALGDPVTPRVVLTIAVPDYGPVSADIAAKSLRRAQNAIVEHGSDGVAVIIQGKLTSGGKISEAGLVAQPKVPKPAVTEAAG